ncbi:MAG: hypothetical protein JSW07_19585 [bacterium]|nr:MAG: hypothetical protein JSW07_19585 [bacterium]
MKLCHLFKKGQGLPAQFHGYIADGKLTRVNQFVDRELKISETKDIKLI